VIRKWRTGTVYGVAPSTRRLPVHLSSAFQLQNGRSWARHRGGRGCAASGSGAATGATGVAAVVPRRVRLESRGQPVWAVPGPSGKRRNGHHTSAQRRPADMKAIFPWLTGAEHYPELSCFPNWSHEFVEQTHHVDGALGILISRRREASILSEPPG